MIKFGIRKNLIYPLMLIIYTSIRKIDSILMIKINNFEASLFLTYIMFLGEFVFGLIIYLSNLRFLAINRDSKESTNRNSSILGIKLIQRKSKLKIPDKKYKIYFIIFMATFFDFNVFLLQTYYLPAFYKFVSESLIVRLRSTLTISSAFLCYFLLRIPIYRHQIFSLIMISICLIIIIFTEYFYERIAYLHFALLFIFFVYFFNSCLDVSEKYLLEYNYINPFKLLMLEGIIGLILVSIFSIWVNPLKEIIEVFDGEKSTYKLYLLIIFLIIYFLSSGGRNIYRILTNKLYSPMTRTLTDCILDPLLLFFYFISEEDFKSKGERNLLFFIINIIASFLIVFSSCVYNELFVLFCCNLEFNTYHQISKRSTIYEALPNESADNNA